MEFGSCHVGCRCTKVTVSNNFVAADSNSDLVRFFLLRTDVADRPNVCWGDTLGLCFTLNKEIVSSDFESSVSLGELAPLILV